MPSISTSLRENWTTLAQWGVFFVSIFSGFLIDLPIETNENNHYSNYAKFLSIGVTAMLFIPIGLFRLKKHGKFWLILAAICFFIGPYFVYHYHNSMDKYVVVKDGEQMIIGKKEEIFPSVILVLEERYGKPISELNIKDVIESTGRPNTYYWPEEVLRKSKNIILLNYFSAFLCYTIFVLCVLQSLKCYRITV
ncbi:MAG: hypothetical protein F9K23_11655 [Bacteroidetes bacterium]|nr:MAG: hypothetical protein F9K23_11655 [Bacteroidota bacterium]